MGGKKDKGGGEGSKKAAGQARKADAAAAKAAAEEAKKQAAEDAKWQAGAKNSSKKEAEAAKKAEAARKKAEKEALLAEDEKNTPGRALPKNKQTAEKKPSRGIDAAFSQLDIGSNKKTELSATGIDAALDILKTDGDGEGIKILRHAERRYKAALEAYIESNEARIKQEYPGLRQNQRYERLKKEFDKSPDNPKNQLSVAHNATKEEIKAAIQAEKDRIESIYAAK
ncbi:hypothetical protein F5Y17DRAFT_410981 [Xylariaceae sp. FL0594]|nr:hypothetical protein F5Y17DRAFT_410981 [Xylariaceae sp. FL0594]